MQGDAESGGSLDMAAVGTGVLWGLMLMLAGGAVQGIFAFRSPLAPGAESMLPLVWQALGAMLAGCLAGRRAGGIGWLHGALAGIGLAMAVALVMGVLTALPTAAAFAKALGIGAGVGAATGIAGVNWSAR